MKNEEKAILAAIEAKLAAHRERLSLMGITFSPPECEVWDPEPSTYTSEVRVKIYVNGMLSDSLEFHIFRNGEQVVTVDEAKEWHERELNALPR